jgi:hypothetical protein
MMSQCSGLELRWPVCSFTDLADVFLMSWYNQKTAFMFLLAVYKLTCIVVAYIFYVLSLDMQLMRLHDDTKQLVMRNPPSDYSWSGGGAEQGEDELDSWCFSLEMVCSFTDLVAWAVCRR